MSEKVAQMIKKLRMSLYYTICALWHMLQKYAVSEDEMEELISIGTIGLIKQCHHSRLITEIVLRPLQSDVSK